MYHQWPTYWCSKMGATLSDGGKAVLHTADPYIAPQIGNRSHEDVSSDQQASGANQVDDAAKCLHMDLRLLRCYGAPWGSFSNGGAWRWQNGHPFHLFRFSYNIVRSRFCISSEFFVFRLRPTLGLWR